MASYKVYKHTGLSKNDDGIWVDTKLENTFLIITLDEVTAKNICTCLKKEGKLESANMRILFVTDVSKSIIEVCKRKDKEPLYRLILM